MCIHICPFVLIDFKKSKQSKRLLTFLLNDIEFTTVPSSYVFMEFFFTKIKKIVKVAL